MFYWYYPLATNMQTQGGNLSAFFVADLLRISGCVKFIHLSA
jgi:hypothetical protein